MSALYHKVIATIDGEQEELYGSFVKADCEYEIEAERDSWKEEGYKGIKIVSTLTEEEPDTEVYTDQERQNEIDYIDATGNYK